jgi:hypothetical protein
MMQSSSRPRYLTKSRFKMAIECPSKLFYTGKPNLYPDAKQEDDFLIALAEGGFQVGELAKLMYPGGVEVTAKTHQEQIDETARLLERDEVTIFEGAICYGGLFARVDVLRKTGSQVELIEVKAKSFDSTAKILFRGARGGIESGMLPYLQDVAFQRHLISLAYPDFSVRSFLMLADKSKTCSVDGLNQRFKIRRQDGRPLVTVTPGTDAVSLGTAVLTSVNVDEYVDEILREPLIAPGTQGYLADLARDWAEKYRADSRIPPTVGAHCAKCEFRTSPKNPGLQSGVHACWKIARGWTESDFAKGSVLDLWNFKGKQKLIDADVLSLGDVTKEHLKYKEGTDGLSRSERQWMQASGEWLGDTGFYIDTALMQKAMASWTFPLHFIDFETSRVAIPFFSGQRPYANIAFQFSHHTVQADGQVAHKSQFLSTAPGVNPNYEFIRQLAAALGSDGTVFMWSPHENTTLNAVLDELQDDVSPPADAARLKEFIHGLTSKKGDGRMGQRSMVDLCRLAEKAFFHPATKASCSIKKVLPAVMQSSDYLKQRYSMPLYGAQGGIPSLNFSNQIWWQESNGTPVDPYKLLPPVFTDLAPELLQSLESDDELEIAQGGAATTAYARLQFEDLSLAERQNIEAALLRYCELDTLAMVMIYEAWREWVEA